MMCESSRIHCPATSKYMLALVYVGILVFIYYIYIDFKSQHAYSETVHDGPFLAIKAISTNQTRKAQIDIAGSLTVIPRRIFMLWDKGWSVAPRMQTFCLNSFRRYNPEFEITALNLSHAEYLIDRRIHYSDKAWRSATIQAKSDIIRVELLAKYGGIWADATVYCNEPLLNWLNNSILRTGFFAYERKDIKTNEQNSPWIASWFLVSTKSSKIIQNLRNAVRDAWAQKPKPSAKLGYFWLHRIFRTLVLNDTIFGEHYKATPVMNANGPHCLMKNTLPHIYKIKARWCSNIRKKVLKQTH